MPLALSLSLICPLSLSLPLIPSPRIPPRPCPGHGRGDSAKPLLHCEPAMHSSKAVSTAVEEACEQGHSGVRSFGSALRRGLARIWLRGRGNLPWWSEAKRKSARSLASAHAPFNAQGGYLKGSLHPELESWHPRERMPPLGVATPQTPRRGLALRPARDAEVSYL